MTAKPGQVWQFWSRDRAPDGIVVQTSMEVLVTKVTRNVVTLLVLANDLKGIYSLRMPGDVFKYGRYDLETIWRLLT